MCATHSYELGLRLVVAAWLGGVCGGGLAGGGRCESCEAVGLDGCKCVCEVDVVCDGGTDHHPSFEIIGSFGEVGLGVVER
jgi:hypothetical protein